MGQDRSGSRTRLSTACVQQSFARDSCGLRARRCVKNNSNGSVVGEEVFVPRTTDVKDFFAALRQSCATLRDDECAAAKER